MFLYDLQWNFPSSFSHTTVAEDRPEGFFHPVFFSMPQVQFVQVQQPGECLLKFFSLSHNLYTEKNGNTDRQKIISY